MRLLRTIDVKPDLLKELTFENPTSDSGSVRVGAANNGLAISLKTAVPYPGAQPQYPLGEGYRVVFPLINVPLVSGWGLVQFNVVLPENPNADPRTVTSIRVRAHDGTDQYIHDGSAWNVVSDLDADWNSFEELKNGLADWTGPLGLTFELSTTDSAYTPLVRGFKIVYEVDLEDEFNDWVYGALVGPMQDEIRPRHDVAIVSAGSLSINFGTIIDGSEGGWDFVEVIAVYDDTDDPAHATDLLASYDSGTRIATLSSAPPVGNIVRLRATYAPTVAVSTEQDYYELAKVPAIVFETIDVDDIGYAPVAESIVDEFADPPTAIIFPPPRHVHIDFSLVLMASLATDLGRLRHAVGEFLATHPLVTSPITGEEATLIVTGGLSTSIGFDRTGVRSGMITFKLKDVYFHDRPPVEAGDGAPESEYAYGVSAFQAEVEVGSTTVTVEVE